jgi:uncharacterized membrane protein YeaQ/YmgE (transglycosylase-associated protein family)
MRPGATGHTICMGFLGHFFSILITGLVIGGLGRLAVPGPNPIGLGLTIAIGVGGSIIGGLLAALIGGGLIVALVLEIAVSAGLVVLVSRRGGKRRILR